MNPKPKREREEMESLDGDGEMETSACADCARSAAAVFKLAYLTPGLIVVGILVLLVLWVDLRIVITEQSTPEFVSALFRSVWKGPVREDFYGMVQAALRQVVSDTGKVFVG